MVAEPAETEVMSPEFDTVAIAALLEVHESVLLAAFDGATVAVICCVCESVIETVVGLTVILETRTGAVAVVRYDAKFTPLKDPHPVQLSKPACAENPPFDPEVIS